MTLKLPIYMDYHATTPVDPRVLDAMMPYLTEAYGNAASTAHPFGWQAKEAVEKARIQIAELIGAADTKEIVFTSGATESINEVLKGIAESYGLKGDHIITQVTEHKAVLDSCKYLQKKGHHVTYLGVDQYGQIHLDELKATIKERTILVSIMFANNEIGTVQPIQKIGDIVKGKGVLFHVDAAQAAGKIPINVETMGIDLLSISGHKLYAPKGVGVLYVRRKHPHVRLSPLLHGGGHEHGMRSGTLNVPAIVGLGRACEIAREEMDEENKRLKILRDRLEAGLRQRVPEIVLNGHPEERLAGNLNLSFKHVEADALLKAINQTIAVSTGSACTSASAEPSHVLKALGRESDTVQTSLRFGLGRFNTEEEIDYVISHVAGAVQKLREESPVYQESKKKVHG